jgi:hypothetical protein
MRQEEITISLKSGKDLNLTFEEMSEIRGPEMVDSLKKSYNKQLENRTQNFFDFEAEQLVLDKSEKNSCKVTLLQQLGEFPYGIPYLRFKEPHFRGDSLFEPRFKEDSTNYWELTFSGIAGGAIDRAQYNDVEGISRLVDRLKKSPVELLAVEQSLTTGRMQSVWGGHPIDANAISQFIEKSKSLPQLDYSNILPLERKGYKINKVAIVDPALMRLIVIPGLAFVSHPHKSLKYIDKDIRSTGYIPIKKKDEYRNTKERLLVTKRWGKFMGNISRNITPMLAHFKEPSGEAQVHEPRSRVRAYVGPFGLFNHNIITLEQRDEILPIAKDNIMSPWEKSIKINEILESHIS